MTKKKQLCIYLLCDELIGTYLTFKITFYWKRSSSFYVYYLWINQPGLKIYWPNIYTNYKLKLLYLINYILSCNFVTIIYIKKTFQFSWFFFPLKLYLKYYKQLKKIEENRSSHSRLTYLPANSYSILLYDHIGF